MISKASVVPPDPQRDMRECIYGGIIAEITTLFSEDPYLRNCGERGRRPRT